MIQSNFFIFKNSNANSIVKLIIGIKQISAKKEGGERLLI